MTIDTGQTTLFPLDAQRPQGFTYWNDFISPQEEEELLNVISRIKLHPLIFQGFEAKRKVKSFGYDYHFDSRSISKGQPIPEDFIPLVRRVSESIRIPRTDIKELLVTEYPPGAVINWHRDAPPFDVVVGISLLSDCKLRFRPHDKAKQARETLITIPVHRRSLYVIRDEARTAWEHSISPVKETRYSVTLRTMR